MQAGFAIMDSFRQRNESAFVEKFGKDAESKLEEWLLRASFQDPAMIAKDMSTPDDPARQKARQMLEEEAEKRVKNLQPSAVAGYFDKWAWVPGTAPSAPSQPMQSRLLVADYQEEFKRAYVITGDESKAQELAVRRLNRIWGPSELGGSAMMRYAPEKAPGYPPLGDGGATGGPHDWLKEQFEAAMIEAIDPERMTALPPDLNRQPGIVRRRAENDARRRLSEKDAQEFARRSAMLAAPKMLVADQRTEREWTAGLPPSYPIVIRLPDGRHEVMTDAQNRPMRFRGDPEAARAGRREGFARRDGIERQFLEEEQRGAAARDAMTGAR
jgi:hypothetical protein